jgi:dTDP-glucose 4,6-dehydratase
MRILVTGGLGFIGSHFVRMLLGEFSEKTQIAEVVIVDSVTYAADSRRISDVNQDPRLKIVKGNILDLPLMTKLLETTDIVFNFAAESHVDNSIMNPNAFIETNILGVQNIINAILKAPKQPLFVQVSTDEVYGEVMEGSSSEDQVLNPSSPYSASKAAAELLILAAARTHSINYRITRGCNTYGPGQFAEKFIPLVVQRIRESKPIPVYGDGNQLREWIFVEDHCRGIWLVAKKGKSNSIYNIGSSVHYSNMDVVRILLDLLTPESFEIQHVDDRLGHDRRYSIDSTKAKNDLGFETFAIFTDAIVSCI